MSSIAKQIIINHLIKYLPKEMIDIIKDYLFYNIIHKTIKYKNNALLLLSSNILKKERDIMEHHGCLIVKIPANINFNCRFCNKCGDYLCSYEMTYYFCKC
jgi:hypothetical protein